MTREEFYKKLEGLGFKELVGWGGDNWKQYAAHAPGEDDHILVYCQINRKYDFFLDCRTKALRPLEELHHYLIELGILGDDKDFDAHTYLIKNGFNKVGEAYWAKNNFNIYFPENLGHLVSGSIYTSGNYQPINSTISYRADFYCTRDNLKKAIKLVDFLIELEK